MIGIETVRVVPRSTIPLEKPLRLLLRLEVRAVAIAHGVGTEWQARQQMGASQGEPGSNDSTTRAGHDTIRHEHLHDHDSALMSSA
jgi:hypothetical protein